MKTQIEQFTGNKITRKNLKEAIETSHRATKAFRRLQELRKGNPVIMGRDAMLVNQTYCGMTRNGGQRKLKPYVMNLRARAQRKDWVCPPDTPRVMVTGTPMFWPDNWKLPTLG